jgi:hypothetical protein
MSKYFYIVFNPKEPRREHRGIIEGHSLETVAEYFFKRGYAIRELKTASKEDVYIDKLKNYRDKLSGTHRQEPELPEIKPEKPRIINPKWLWLALIFALWTLIMYLLLKGLQ